ncbi:MAG: hypothetical protein ACJZ5P_06680 [Candidatus Thalassarchaeaceae archaeon]
MGDVLHYSTQRSNQWWNSNDEVYRIALNNNTSFTICSGCRQPDWHSSAKGIRHG